MCCLRILACHDEVGGSATVLVTSFLLAFYLFSFTINSWTVRKGVLTVG
jgi:hypothetical protein